jgi:hypothetical protein
MHGACTRRTRVVGEAGKRIAARIAAGFSVSKNGGRHFAFPPYGAVRRAPKWTKVFWFFFAKKNILA